jgi:hypothetical protein
MWGQLLNCVRGTGRLVATWVRDDEAMGRIVNGLAATAIAHKQSLRGDKKVDEFAGLMTEEEAKGLLAADHMALAALDHVSEQIRLAAKSGACVRVPVASSLGRKRSRKRCGGRRARTLPPLKPFCLRVRRHPPPPCRPPRRGPRPAAQRQHWRY